MGLVIGCGYMGIDIWAGRGAWVLVYEFGVMGGGVHISIRYFCDILGLILSSTTGQSDHPY